ncbi:hypothetical protein NE645_09340 [Roseburia hominis]|nr:hypothetical protein [Roseburia hominis]
MKVENNNKETKICKKCGRELPLDKFIIKQSYIYMVSAKTVITRADEKSVINKDCLIA